MEEALREAVQALALGEVPVGAIVVHDGQIVGRGHNRSLTDCDPSAHAEVIALRQAAAALGHYRLDDAVLYVTLEPCLMCCGALLQSRIARLVFAAREPRTGAVLSQFDALMSAGHSHHIAISEGPLADESTALLQRFFRERR